MPRIAFVGHGELGRQVSAFLEGSLSGRETHFFDDKLYGSGYPNSHPFSEYTQGAYADCSYYICLGYKHLPVKLEVVTELTKLGRALPSFISKTSYVSSSADVSSGTIVYPMCNIDKNVFIGKGVILNNSVVVSHNSSVEDCSYLSPGVILSGQVSIGKCCFIGSGSIIANGVQIGDGVTVGIGSVISNNISSGANVIGNPARVLETPLKLR